MNKIKFIVFTLLFLFSLQGFAAESGSKSTVDVKEIVLGHLSDSYDWHITTWNGQHVSIPLLVIVKSNTTGWHVFSSRHLEEGYEGFYVNEADGKIYETATKARPIDLSITKNVVEILFVAALMLLVFLSCARWYKGKKAGDKAPKGFVGFIEMFVMMVNDDIVKPSVGEKHYKKYAPYLLTAFFFIFFTNVIGILPIFPGGANVTGNISITLFLALCTFLAVNLFGNKEYWKEIFWPDVPVWLKCPVPMMPVIEFFGILTKPFALMVRLFANIMGGHAIILSFTCVIFVTCQLGAGIGGPLSVVSFLLMLFMDCLELLVAFIQAYVFTMLSAVFIGLAHQEEHAEIQEK